MCNRDNAVAVFITLKTGWVLYGKFSTYSELSLRVVKTLLTLEHTRSKSGYFNLRFHSENTLGYFHCEGHGGEYKMKFFMRKTENFFK